MSPPKRGWRPLLVVLCISAVAIGLLCTRPWHSPYPGCLVTVQPGESIQAAIDSAEAGAVICLAAGAWIENISIDRPLILTGMGARRTFIEPARGLEPVIAVSGQDSEVVDVRIKGLAIQGLGGGSGVSIRDDAVVEISDCTVSSRLIGIEATDSARLTVVGCTLSALRQRGMVLSGEAQATIRGSRIFGNLGPGLWISHTAEVALVDCEIYGNSSHGLRVQHDASVTLDNCSVSANQGCGLWLTERSTAQVRVSSMSRNADQGIKAQGSTKLDITDSDLFSNWHGIELTHQAEATVLDSRVSMNRWDGIRIQHYVQAAISNSAVTINGRGVWVTGQANAEITDCLIEKNTGYGVFSLSRGEVSGAGNRLNDNGADLGGNLPGTLRAPLREAIESEISWPDARYASLQEAVDALIPGGTLLLTPGTYTGGLTIGKQLRLEGHGGQAILVAKSDALPVLSLVDGAELNLRQATLSGGASGLLVSAGARAVLTECTVSGNTDGINLSYSSSVEMADCTITDNGRNGVAVGDSAQATITRCMVSRNNGYGVALADSAQATITETTITQSRGEGGLVLRGSCQAVLENNTILDNRGFGVTIVQHPCFLGSPWVFDGRISGHSNAFSGNWQGDVCPPELGFLSTPEGGELGFALSSS